MADAAARCALLAEGSVEDALIGLLSAADDLAIQRERADQIARALEARWAARSARRLTSPVSAGT